MRRVFLLVLAGSALVAIARTPAPMKLRALSQPLAEVSAPPPDPVVHCLTDDVGEFVRRSTCLAGGGRVHEPAWSLVE